MVGARPEECFFWGTHAGEETFPMRDRVGAVAFGQADQDLQA